MQTLNHNGKTLTIQQDAYLAGTNEAPVYQARATDEAGNNYTVTWQPYDNLSEIEDGADACDWERYTVRSGA